LNSTELNEEQRAFLLQHLREIDSALIEYRFRGSKPLQYAVAAAFGDALAGEILSGRRCDAA
jgi:hypothetical protein